MFLAQSQELAVDDITYIEDYDLDSECLTFSCLNNFGDFY